MAHLRILLIYIKIFWAVHARASVVLRAVVRRGQVNLVRAYDRLLIILQGRLEYQVPRSPPIMMSIVAVPRAVIFRGCRRHLLGSLKHFEGRVVEDADERIVLF